MRAHWLLFVGTILVAQDFGSELGESKGVKRVGMAIDNDVKELSGVSGDRFYTNGVRLWALTPKELPYFLPEGMRNRLTRNEDNQWSSGWVIGQQIFTPENIKDPNPQPKDRPWGGWLYAGGIGRFKSNHHLYEVEITAGVVGPGSGGRQVQSEFHRLIRSPHPEGWDNQIVSKPTFQTRLDYTYLDYIGTVWGQVLEGHMTLGIRTGNVFRDAHGGLVLRFGNRPNVGPKNDSDTRYQMMASTSQPGRWGWYIYTQWGMKAVDRNLLIQGETPTGNPTLELKTQVQEMAIGAALFIPLTRARSLELIARRVRRTEEFVGQRGPQQYGTISLVWHTRI
ncbi:MAG: lipid A deacylase LpxR family protein [Acidobacteria bacterium]|nr:lipid A deacylase LpxR family protein [Acidobacteriota bacterium]